MSVSDFLPESGLRPTSGGRRPISAGSRVTMIPSSGSPPGDTKPQVGVVVGDFTDAVIERSELGREGSGAAVGENPRKSSTDLRIDSDPLSKQPVPNHPAMG
ncbi:hypothetical protein [Rhodococcus erythropolis]|uniref:Uncharacterized protein n=1 Tax=Rhodococcus erythropolis (strain PR4 / NBRC 100887) TaxID=234621 RepID=C0ZLH6_RHOE4|nr:hypothetical protein [Rhodococcus erythropolis]BAH30744.1 hypothetical protein RER_00360 [Rhodococcus erythropolis PR4]